MLTRIRISRGVASLIFSLILLLAACNSEPAVESSGASTIPPGTYTTTFTADDNILDGRMTGSASMTFEESGAFTVNLPGAVIKGQYTITGDQVTFNESDPTFPCANYPMYVYTWKVEGAQLTFGVVDDPCQPRVSAMTLKPYVKEE